MQLKLSIALVSALLLPAWGYAQGGNQVLGAATSAAAMTLTPYAISSLCAAGGAAGAAAAGGAGALAGSMLCSLNGAPLAAIMAGGMAAVGSMLQGGDGGGYGGGGYYPSDPNNVSGLPIISGGGTPSGGFDPTAVAGGTPSNNQSNQTAGGGGSTDTNFNVNFNDNTLIASNRSGTGASGAFSGTWGVNNQKGSGKASGQGNQGEAGGSKSAGSNAKNGGAQGTKATGSAGANLAHAVGARTGLMLSGASLTMGKGAASANTTLGGVRLASGMPAPDAGKQLGAFTQNTAQQGPQLALDTNVGTSKEIVTGEPKAEWFTLGYDDGQNSLPKQTFADPIEQYQYDNGYSLGQQYPQKKPIA